jgi:hypothetical protein
MHRFLIIALALAMANPTQAASFERPYSMTELSQRAETVFIGQVLGTWTEVNGDGWWTVARLAVEETLQGEHQSVIEVRYPGGTMGELHMVVPGSPSLTQGDQVVVFARENGVVLGLAQGVWQIQSPGVATRNLSQLSFHDGSRPVQSISLDELRRLVR